MYSGDLKAKLDLTQDELQSIAAIGNVGLYLTFFSGFAFDFLGPHVTSGVAVVLTLTGYLLMWAGASGVLPGSVGLLSAAAFIWSHGSSWGDLASISVQTRNFPQDRGLVLGVLKSFFGLSATVFTVAYDALFPGNAPAFLLFLAVVTPSLLLVGGASQRLATERATTRLSPRGVSRMTFGYLVVVATAIYATVVVVLIKYKVLRAGDAGWFVGVLVIVLAFAFVAFPILPCHREEGADAGEYGAINGAGASDATESLVHDRERDAGGAAAAPEFTAGADTLKDEVTIAGASLLEGLTSLDYWLIVMILFAGTGAGLTLINNVGQLVPALGGDGAAVYVALLGVGNAFGRMAFGMASDAFRRVLSRPAWITASVLTMALSMLVTAFADLGVLYAAVFLTGFAYGGFWSLMPAFLADRFGTRSFATLYAFAMLAPAAGSILLGEKLASAVYQSNSEHGSKTCIGPECYRATFLILCGLCAVATAIGGYLTWKTRDTYRALLVAAGEIDEEEEEEDLGAVAGMGGGENKGAVLGRAGFLGDSPLDTPEVEARRDARRKRRERQKARG